MVGDTRWRCHATDHAFTGAGGRRVGALESAGTLSPAATPGPAARRSARMAPISLLAAEARQALLRLGLERRVLRILRHALDRLARLVDLAGLREDAGLLQRRAILVELDLAGLLVT